MEYSFNARFAKLLKAKGIKPSQVAKKMNVSRQVVDNYLGNTLPGFSHLLKIIGAFPEVNLRWLILGEGDEGVNEEELIDMFQVEKSNIKLETIKMLWNEDRKELNRLRLMNNRLVQKIMDYDGKIEELNSIIHIEADSQQMAGI
ncbi:MAG: helix-turn-helix transcriptional regulator [Lentimicrobium sp.]|nr:helix-turn-helix transcriptional regulator [Lentimicrobium sp.]